MQSRVSFPVLYFENLIYIISTTFCFIVGIHIDNDQVLIEQFGTNTSFINQTPINATDKQLLNDGDILHLLENEHSYTIRIERTILDKFSPIQPTLKRRNTDDDQISLKKRKDTSDSQNIDDPSEENRAIWIQQQLNALQTNATQSYIFK
jgi:hypothetical protein